MSFFKPELFCEYERRIADLPMQPFTVSVETLFPVYHTDSLTLDGLLAWCVVWKLFEGKPPGYGGDAWWIPLPLKELARHKELPLWAATDFRAINPHHDSTNYHRRSGDNPYSGFALKETSNTRRPRRIPSSVNGQYMDYRIPEQLEIADRWEAEGIGNINEVSHLLKLVQNLGRGGSRGRGRIRKIEIRALEDFSLVTPEGRLKKNVPIEIDIGLNHNKDRIQFAGWTPAYWQQKNWEYCYLA